MPSDIMFFSVVETIGNLIQNNITDLNPKRPKTKWVFPQFPDEDSNLPEVVVKIGAVSYDPDSAGNVFYEEETEEGFIEYFYKKATAPLNLIVMTAKKNLEAVEITHNGNKLFLKNQPLNLYLTNQVKNLIFTERETILQSFDDIQINNIDPSFDNNDWSWSSIISCEIVYKDCFKRVTGNDGIVQTYSLNMAIKQ